MSARRPGGVAGGLCLLACLGLATPSWGGEEAAKGSPWQVSADKISRFADPPSIIAEGNVVLSREGIATVADIQNPAETRPPGLKPLTISGDWIRVDMTTSQIRVRGHAVLDSEEEHVTADLADLDMEHQTGRLQHATIYFPKSSLYLAGEEVEKISDLTYHLRDGWVTKCGPVEGETPPWSFGWGQADVSQGGFAHFTNATFRVKDLPVAYSPYVAFPTNTKRKTGLLLPEWTASHRDGVGVLVPLFVNISPSQDLTLYGGEISDRGAVAGAEYRYVLEQRSKGTLAVSYLNDTLWDSPGDDFKGDGIFRTQADRYWLRGKADHDFGADISAKLDIDVVSDQDYLEEFPDGQIGYTESAAAFLNDFGRGFDGKTSSARTNTAQLSKAWPAMTLGGEMRVIQDSGLTPSTSHPWSLPAVFFAGRQSLTGLLGAGHSELLAATDLTWDSGYVSYWRETGVEEQRLDLYPVLKAPLPLAPYLETTAALGLRQTMYQVENNGVDSPGYDMGAHDRTLADATLATSTLLLRDFDLGSGWLRQLTHMVRPGLAYTYRPGVEQGYLPYIDDVDRLGGRNLLTYDLRNNFDVVGGDGQAWTFGYARLSQAYDIDAARRELAPGESRRQLTDIVFDSWLQPLPDLHLFYKTAWDVYGDGAANYRLGLSYGTRRGDRLLAEHRYDPAQLINQLNFLASVRLTHTLQAQALVNHSLETDETSDASLRLLYTPACWGVVLQATTTPEDDYRISLLFTLDGVGNILGLSQTMTSADGRGGLFR